MRRLDGEDLARMDEVWGELRPKCCIFIMNCRYYIAASAVALCSIVSIAVWELTPNFCLARLMRVRTVSVPPPQRCGGAGGVLAGA